MSKVLLIAGHGRNYNGTYDPGAVSVFGREADYTRELVEMVSQSIGNTVPVDMYDMDKNCYSFSKAGQAPDYGAYGLVVEIHFNAKAKKDESGDGRFTGAGAYVHPDNSEGRRIAECIINAMVELGFGKWQICSSTGLHNLNKAQKAGTRYLLLETAFIDDGDDMAWYNANKTAVAKTIAQEIINAAGGNAPASTPTITPAPTTSDNAGYVGMYKVNVDDLNIRSGPGTSYDKVGSIKDHGTYTIVEMVGNWGRFKSGAGWINCSAEYCIRVGDADVDIDAEPEDNLKFLEVWVKIKNLYIRKGPGTSYGTNGYCTMGVYNILETDSAEGHVWGCLKSGAGWIAMDPEYIEKIG